MKEFIIFIRTIVGIDDLDLQLVLSRCTKRQIPKGKLILKKGQIAKQYFFIVSGGVRFFYEGNDQENTT
jgi:CRP-like cAMP-binding protein